MSNYKDHTEPDTKGEFNRIAPAYNQSFANTFDEAEEEFIFSKFAHLLRRRDVLDIGCGTGLVKRLADRDLFKMRSYVGVDYSEGMISEALARLPVTDWHPNADVKFVVGDMVELMNSMPAGSFDTVVAMYFPLNYCENDLAEVYNAINRVLRRDGFFINVTATSRYAVRKSHIVSANHMRRYFDDGPYHTASQPVGKLPEAFLFKEVIGTNYAIEKYRSLMKWCPKSVNKLLFEMDREKFKRSGRKPLIYTYIFEKFLS